jgi:hypothetical protein
VPAQWLLAGAEQLHPYTLRHYAPLFLAKCFVSSSATLLKDRNRLLVLPSKHPSLALSSLSSAYNSHGGSTSLHDFSSADGFSKEILERS